MRYNTVIMLVLLLPLASSSQSVEEFIEMAKAYNPGLKSMQLEYEAAQLRADQVDDWPDPKVNLAIGVLPIETRLGAQRFKVGAAQTIPWKGLLNAKREVAASNAEIISQKDELKAIDIEYAIRSAYHTLQFLEAKITNINDKMHVLEALEEIAKSAVRSGKGKLSNVLFVERKKEMLASDKKLISKEMDQPRIVINRWAGRNLNDSIFIRPTDKLLLNKDQIVNTDLGNHPQFKTLDHKINASNSRVNLTTYEAKPKLTFGLEYSYIDARNDVDIPNNGRDVIMPMGSISIPLNTGRYSSIRQEEALRQEALAIKRAEIMDQYTSEITLAQAKIEYAEEVINKFLSLKRITNETIKLMRTEYASEGTRFEELLKLEMELIDYDLEILKAEYLHNISNATLLKFKL